MQVDGADGIAGVSFASLISSMHGMNVGLAVGRPPGAGGSYM